MSQGASFPLAGRRGLLLLIGTWLLQGATALSAHATTIRSERPSRVELQSSGSFVQVRETPAKEASTTTSEVWPEAATAKDEVNMGILKGGTHPLKVKIGANVFVRKKVLEKDSDSQGIMMEALANELYRAAQVKSESCRYYPAPASDHSKKPQAYILCRFIDGLDPVITFTDQVKQAVSEHFVLDAAFAAYDVGGTNGDNKKRYGRGNVGWDSDKNLVRIDSGGALAADGLGAWKPTAYKCKDRLFTRMTTWSPEPFQLWDFQRTSEIYKHISKEEILSQVKGVMARKEDILAAVDSFQHGVAAEKVKTTLKARLECLGRIAKDRADLFDVKHLQDHRFDQELPSAVCDGVRTLCADLLK